MRAAAAEAGVDAAAVMDELLRQEAQEADVDATFVGPAPPPRADMEAGGAVNYGGALRPGEGKRFHVHGSRAKSMQGLMDAFFQVKQWLSTCKRASAYLGEEKSA